MEPNETENVTFETLRESKFDASVLEFVLYSIGTSLIISFTLGIATPWAVCFMYKFVISHIVLDGKRLVFDGTGGQLFGNWIKWLIFIVITCGIYSFWVAPRLIDWIVKHTHFEEA